MSLINCHECGEQVSSEAAACPKCGAKPKVRRRSDWKGILLALIVGLVFIGWLASTSSSPPAVAQSAGPAAQPPEKPIAISATELYSEYQANEVKADMKFKGKLLAVGGSVQSIQKDVLDDPFVVLSVGQGDFVGVQAQFAKGAAGELSKLHKGDDVTLTCNGGGMIAMNPILDCKGS